MTVVVSDDPDFLSDSQYAFIARLDSIKVFLQLMKAINFKDRANCFLSDTGLKVSVDDVRCVQMSAFVSKGLFDEFKLKEGRGNEEGSDDLSFSVNLNAVIECLNVFGGAADGGPSPHLKMCYAGYGSPLILFLEHQGVITDCKIKTREVEECADFNFSHSNVISKIIMNSEHLKDVFTEMDTSCDLIDFHITKENFQLSTSGSAGGSSAEVPQDSDIVEQYHCSAAVSAKFKLSMLRHGLKPLAFSERVSVRMDDRDFLCMQHMVKTPDGPAFLEFYCAPEEDIPDY